MKTAPLLIVLALGLVWTRLPAAETAAHPPIHMVIVGDSTVCNYPETTVRRGWGMFIQGYFNSNELKVVNLALSGRSTKTFIQEGHWAGVLKARPDFVLIQFGHNDSHTPDHPEATDASTAYPQYLRQYIDEARAAGARPVLITPMCRRSFQTNGLVDNALLPYANAMKAVAREKQVPLVDLNAASVRLCDQLGPDACKSLANDAKDATHFNAKGARAMAGLVMRELPVVEPALQKYLKPAPAGPQ